MNLIDNWWKRLIRYWFKFNISTKDLDNNWLSSETETKRILSVWIQYSCPKTCAQHTRSLLEGSSIYEPEKSRLNDYLCGSKCCWDGPVYNYYAGTRGEKKLRDRKVKNERLPLQEWMLLRRTTGHYMRDKRRNCPPLLFSIVCEGGRKRRKKSFAQIYN